MRRLQSIFLLSILCFSGAVRADDWPQWLGPQRDSHYREDGVVDRFPESGLKVRWRAPLGLGYAGPAVAGGRVYVMDYLKAEGTVMNNPGAPDRLQGKERVLCLDSATGKVLWKHEYERPYQISFGGGPRTTCTIDDGRVFALGAEGNLWCLDAQSGKVLWSKDFVADYAAKSPFWGVAAHPLVDGDLLYCVVGAADGVAMAFDKRTGARSGARCPPRSQATARRR